MKICKSCNQEKSESEFYNAYYKDKVYSLNECKECTSKRTNKNYYNDHNRQKEIRKKNTNARRLERKMKILEFLLEHSCVDCGEKDPVVLEFDHIKDKSFDISKGHMKPWNIFLEEISKCEVVCANCHKRRTSKRDGNWYKQNAMGRF